jgi:hypothetical protein
VGLREIKRRASRHALVHREFNNQKPGAPTPGTPVEPIPMQQESSDPRLAGIDHTLYDFGVRLQRSEEAQHYMQVKQQAIMETLGRVLYFSGEMSRAILGVVPSDNPIHRDGKSLPRLVTRSTFQRADSDQLHLCNPTFSAKLTFCEPSTSRPSPLTQAVASTLRTWTMRQCPLDRCLKTTRGVTR